MVLKVASPPLFVLSDASRRPRPAFVLPPGCRTVLADSLDIEAMRQWLESGRAGTRSRDQLERSFDVCRDCGVEDDAALRADQVVVMFSEFFGQFEPLDSLSR